MLGDDAADISRGDQVADGDRRHFQRGHETGIGVAHAERERNGVDIERHAERGAECQQKHRSEAQGLGVGETNPIGCIHGLACSPIDRLSAFS